MTYKIGYKRFVLMYAGLTIAIPVLFWAVRASTGYDISSSAGSIIPMMIAAMDQGTQFAKAENRRPEGREAWHVTLRLTGVAITISLVFAVAVLAMNPEILAMVGAVGFVIIVICLALLYWVLGRLFFGMGARNHIKIMDRQG